MAAATIAAQPRMPYQHGQFWVLRFEKQAPRLCAVLTARMTLLPAASFVTRALLMLKSLGWVVSHRFLFSELRMHLLDWPRILAPDG